MTMSAIHLPFGLSLSKPQAERREAMQKASTGSAWPFDRFRANGGNVGLGGRWGVV
ncbi:hypothetical protein VVT58_10590 [Sphingobium sp. SJ10-10]|uniref:hypothetical protein n=1 Tax=Sphingobium sp. SJ10-10 TaxID=3114999 RepID=UPI002E18FF42|nr:hypothetical protein [Sphingobium sp. SJ10-10]